MWKCPKCESNNEYEYCAVCGEAKPIVDESEKMIQQNARVTKILILTIAALAVLMVIIMCVVPMLGNLSAKPKNEENAPISYKETTKPVEKKKDTTENSALQILNIHARKHSDDIDEIIIETTEYTEPEMMTLSDPARVVLDFSGYTLKDKSVSCGISGYNFKDVRKGEHGSYSRVVIDISKSCSVSTQVTDGRCVVTLKPRS